MKINRFAFIHDPARCVFCGTCTAVCPVRALVLRNEKMLAFARRTCTGCLACQKVCPMNACRISKKAGL